jgi:hypothetical protein
MLLALLRPGLLRPSLREPGHPEFPRRLLLHGSSSFTIAGLPPAGLAALWAASKEPSTGMLSKDKPAYSGSSLLKRLSRLAALHCLDLDGLCPIWFSYSGSLIEPV